MRRYLVILAAGVILCLVGLLIGVLLLGRSLSAPTPRLLGPLPEDLQGQNVQFKSPSGSSIHGWFIYGKQGHGGILLLHSVRSNRMEMMDRVRFLNREGYSVLVFDFQAHGESPGDHITFGYLESQDAHAAVAFMRARMPSESIGAIGVSLGGAAALLGPQPLSVDALVLEAVYPTIEEAVADRLTIRLGALGQRLAPLLMWQMNLQLGISPNQLRPIDRIHELHSPLLLIAGTIDQHTTLSESQKLFQQAPSPKEFWAMEGAAHVNFHRFAALAYEQRVLEFFKRYLVRSPYDDPNHPASL